MSLTPILQLLSLIHVVVLTCALCECVHSEHLTIVINPGETPPTYAMGKGVRVHDAQGRFMFTADAPDILALLHDTGTLCAKQKNYRSNAEGVIKQVDAGQVSGNRLIPTTTCTLR